jgi:hypothetical protein
MIFSVEKNPGTSLHLSSLTPAKTVGGNLSLWVRMVVLVRSAAFLAYVAPCVM